MAEQYPELSDGLINFIERQSLFFTGTARSEGRVNVSPKGTDSLRILSNRQLVWRNLTGSGNETAAHLLENKRMTIMFCAFDKKPLILRLYGTACAIHPRDKDWHKYLDLFSAHTGTRQFFVMDIDLVQTSCGFAVPLMNFVGERGSLDTWSEKKGEEGIRDYWKEQNSLSLDGFDTAILPADS